MIYLYNHGGSGNHGCEAIVRSTISMAERPIVLFSQKPDQDLKYGLDNICKIQSDVNSTVKRGSMAWFVSSLQTKLTGKINWLVRFWKKDMLCKVSKNDVLLSIGGDKYCYAGTDIIAAINNNMRRKKAKLVLWGCSIEPELLEKEGIKKDIAGFDLITARESITYEAVKKVNKNTVLAADPAFTLERRNLPLPDGWIEGKMIGINASPLILQNAKNGVSVLDAYKELVRTILKTTDCSIALIPHVVWEDNDDRIPLTVLYDTFKDTGRVILLGDHNCMELKGYIARCRMFIGARTHSTIAAYSSCVPTLVLGYSVKSRGIARDIFGSDENYVIPVQGMQNINELADGFRWMLKNEANIRGDLTRVMPEYVQRAEIGKEELEKLME